MEQVKNENWAWSLERPGTRLHGRDDSEALECIASSVRKAGAENSRQEEGKPRQAVQMETANNHFRNTIKQV